MNFKYLGAKFLYEISELFITKMSNVLRKNLFLIFILFVSVILRFYQLGRFSLWFDEALTLLCDGALKRPFYALTHVNTLLSKNQPSVLYIHRIIFYCWQNIVGLDEFRLRLLPVFFSILAVVGIYFLGKYIFNKEVGAYAALLLAFSPFHIYYAREFRQYSMISFLTIFCVYSLLKAIRYNELKYWVIFIVSLTFNIYMHYIATLIILSSCIFFIMVRRRFKKSIFNFIVSHCIILFLLTPFFIVVIYFAILSIYDWELFYTQMAAHLPSVNITNLFFSLKNFSLGYSIDFNSLFGITGTFFFLALFINGMLKIKEVDKKILLIAYSFFPIIIIFFISLYRVFYVDRHFIPFVSFYYLGIAYGIYYFKRNLRQLIIVIIVLFLSIGLIGMYLDILPKEKAQRTAVLKKKNDRKLSEFLLKNYKNGDIIIHTSQNSTTTLKVYLRNLNLTNSDLRKEAEKCRMLRIYHVNNSKMIYYFEWDDNIYDYPEIFMPIDFIKIKPHSGRIWLVYWLVGSEYFTFDYANLKSVLKIVSNEYKIKYVNNFDGIVLFLCEK